MISKREKTVVITGGNKGIGAVISKIFYESEYSVVIGARDDNNVTAGLGEGAYFVKCDVKKKGDLENLSQEALNLTGRVDVFINCAGYSQWSSVGELGDAFVDQMIDTNLKGVLWGCHAASKTIKEGGSIINLSSLAGKRGSSNNSVYCATKFGVNGITQSLAKELGSKGIRVNAVCPVYIKTKGLLEALEEEASPAGGQEVAEYLDDFEETNTALGRLPTAEEIAKVCVFLAGEGASAVTGQCINVDCGVLPQ